MEWNELHKTLWDLRRWLGEGSPICAVTPGMNLRGCDALDALREHEQDAHAALEAWLQTGVPPCAEGPALRMVQLRLEAAANVASELDGVLALPPEWSERQALSWLLRDLWHSSMQPLLDSVWLEAHGRSEE